MLAREPESGVQVTPQLHAFQSDYASLLSSAFSCRNRTTVKLTTDRSAFASTAHKQQGDECALNTVGVQEIALLFARVPCTMSGQRGGVGWEQVHGRSE